MKNISRIALVAALMAGTPSLASAEGGFANGSELVAQMREYIKKPGDLTTNQVDAYSYVYFIAGVFGNMHDNDMICASAGLTRLQITEVVTADLKNNPADWHYSASSLTARALKEAFPCK
ncbi:MAG: hypothetical protein JKY09_04970 [Crocinitomicaceae bacterium]|nr:hypothetical protein [Crocinitomicaceae bacterium]